MWEVGAQVVGNELHCCANSLTRDSRKNAHLPEYAEHDFRALAAMFHLRRFLINVECGTTSLYERYLGRILSVAIPLESRHLHVGWIA